MFSKLFTKINIFLFYCFLFLSCNGIDSETFSPDEIIKLEVLDFDETQTIDEALGDGETIIKLKAKIPSNSAFKTVKFESTGGTFTLTGTMSHEKTVDSEGYSQVNLRLPLDNQLVSLTAYINNDNETFSSTKSIDLIGVDEVVTLSLLNNMANTITDPIRADGVTIVKLKATINHNRNVFNQVTFTTSMGDLQGTSPVNTDEQNNAYIDVIVPKSVQKLYFSARVGSSNNYFDNKELILVPSHPDFILIEPSMVSMPLNSSNPIDIFLKKNIGFVSLNSTISIRSYQISDDNSEVEVGRFTGLSNASSDSNGLIKVVFKTDTNDINDSKSIFIEVISTNDFGEPINSTIEININQ
ncbi:hypothetical protein [Aquimarina spinulae]|uniref:hypothetical protein n=1 Tax=Aquimarina spinulae TaxID=1192023 RepID=UPI0010527D21|nr:hypothetical protein [Aquimarina spinulae]